MRGERRNGRRGRRGWWAWLAHWLRAQRRRRAHPESPGVTVPVAPGALALTPEDLGIGLAWQDRSDNEDGFRVYRRAWDQPTAAVYETTANVVGWLDKGVEPGVHYTYYVVAFNAAGESASSNEEVGVISAE